MEEERGDRLGPGSGHRARRPAFRSRCRLPGWATTPARLAEIAPQFGHGPSDERASGLQYLALPRRGSKHQGYGESPAGRRGRELERLGQRPASGRRPISRTKAALSHFAHRGARGIPEATRQHRTWTPVARCYLGQLRAEEAPVVPRPAAARPRARASGAPCRSPATKLSTAALMARRRRWFEGETGRVWIPDVCLGRPRLPGWVAGRELSSRKLSD